MIQLKPFVLALFNMFSVYFQFQVAVINVGLWLHVSKHSSLNSYESHYGTHLKEEEHHFLLQDAY